MSPEKKWTDSMLKKGFWLYLFSFIIAPIGYIVKIIVSGQISIEELWILYWILSLITMLSSFNDFWMTESMNFFVPKYLAKKDYSSIKTIIAFSFVTQVITWIIIATLLFFGADYLADNYFKNEAAKTTLQVFCLYFLWINVFQVFNNFFLTIQNTFYNKLTELLRLAFAMICTILITLLDFWNLFNYAATWMVGLYFWIIFVLYFFYHKYYKHYLKWVSFCFSIKLFKEIFSYSIVVFIASQAALILSQLDMQMIIYFLWSREAGYYTNYLSIITIPFLLIGPIFWFLFPFFSKLHAENKPEKIKQIKSEMQKNFIWVALAFNILFFVFAELIAYVLFWEKFIKSGVILQYSILFLIFNFLLQINFSILAWIWKIQTRLKIILLALAFNFILNIILINWVQLGWFTIPHMWVYWAALATSIGWILIWVLSEMKLWKEYISKFDYIYFIKNIFSLAWIWVLIYIYVIPYFEWAGRLESFFYLAFIACTWFGFFILINLWEFKKFIQEIKKLKNKT